VGTDRQTSARAFRRLAADRPSSAIGHWVTGCVAGGTFAIGTIVATLRLRPGKEGVRDTSQKQTDGMRRSDAGCRQHGEQSALMLSAGTAQAYGVDGQEAQLIICTHSGYSQAGTRSCVPAALKGDRLSGAGARCLEAVDITAAGAVAGGITGGAQSPCSRRGSRPRGSLDRRQRRRLPREVGVTWD
jgi:hypothetical protein